MQDAPRSAQHRADLVSACCCSIYRSLLVFGRWHCQNGTSSLLHQGSSNCLRVSCPQMALRTLAGCLRQIMVQQRCAALPLSSAAEVASTSAAATSGLLRPEGGSWLLPPSAWRLPLAGQAHRSSATAASSLQTVTSASQAPATKQGKRKPPGWLGNGGARQHGDGDEPSAPKTAGQLSTLHATVACLHRRGTPGCFAIDKLTLPCSFGTPTPLNPPLLPSRCHTAPQCARRRLAIFARSMLMRRLRRVWSA